jgi:putative glycosyltransferase
MELSIVTTMYLSAAHLVDFYERITPAAKQITDDYEVIFVNDGSPDESLDVALGLLEHDQRVRIVDLSRNYGHHKAMMTGLASSRGELVFLIDGDLEEEPELLGTFYRELRKSGTDTDVAYGVQKTRKGGYFERVSGALFYKAFNLLSTYPIPNNVVTARLMTRRYVDALVQHRDREVFIAGLWAITGFKQIAVLINKHSRGKSSYNLSRKISVFVNSLTSFSVKPLAFIFYLGCIIVLASTIGAAVLIIRKLFFNVLLAGWPSLIVSIWLLGGLTIFCLGVVGIYVAKIFTESKERPYTVVRRIYGQ